MSLAILVTLLVYTILPHIGCARIFVQGPAPSTERVSSVGHVRPSVQDRLRIYDSLQWPSSSTTTWSGIGQSTSQQDPHIEPGFPVPIPGDAGTLAVGLTNQVVVGNIDGDSKLEIMAVGREGIHAWKSDGSPMPGWPATGLEGWVNPSLGNLSPNTPSLEIVAVRSSDRRQLIAISGTLAKLSGWPIESHYRQAQPSLADLDGDGIDEVVAAAFAYRADGSTLDGWPTNNRRGPSEPITDSDSPAVGDLNNDGRPEIVVVGPSSTSFGASVHAFHADGSRVNRFPVHFRAKSWIKGYPVIGDADGDGIAEIIVLGRNDKQQVVVFLISPYAEIKREIRIQGELHRESAPALADLDGDSTPEIIVMSDDRLEIWKGDGTTFPGWPQEWEDRSLESLAPIVGDIDGDQLPDIVSVILQSGRYEEREIRAYKTNGALVAGFPKTLPISHGTVPAIADIDEDGRNELVIAGSGQLWVFDLGGTGRHGRIEWGQFGGGPKHQNFYPLNEPVRPLPTRPPMPRVPGESARLTTSFVTVELYSERLSEIISQMLQLYLCAFVLIGSMSGIYTIVFKWIRTGPGMLRIALWMWLISCAVGAATIAFGVVVSLRVAPVTGDWIVNASAGEASEDSVALIILVSYFVAFLVVTVPLGTLVGSLISFLFPHKTTGVPWSTWVLIYGLGWPANFSLGTIVGIGSISELPSVGWGPIVFLSGALLGGLIASRSLLGGLIALRLGELVDERY